MRKYYNAPMDLQRRFIAVKSFLRQHERLLQSEVLNSYPAPLPSPYHEWTQELEALEKAHGEEELLSIECDFKSELLKGDFKLYIQTLADLTRLPSYHGQRALLSERLERGITLKKREEIKTLKSFLAETSYQNFLDIGSGKGHLSMALMLERSGSSLCVDMDRQLQEAGKKKIRDYLPELEDKIQYQTERFHSGSSVQLPEGSLALALHCCGDLSVEAMDFHLKRQADLLNFGCCYHKGQRQNLSQVAQKDPLELSNHALHLASRSNRRLSLEDYRRRQKVKRYRYALHMLLVDECGESFSALGSAHHSEYSLSFSDYALKYAPQLKELDLNGLYARYRDSRSMRTYLLSETIRAGLGRVAEIYLLLDRTLRLREQGLEATISEFFDSSLSPRNIGIYSRHDRR